MGRRRADTPRLGSRRLAGAWLGWWAVLAGLWLAITDTRQVPELILGAFVAAVGASAAWAALHERELRLKLPRRALRYSWRPFWRLLVDTGIVAGALWRHLVLRRPVRGRFRAVRFAGGERPEDSARRALAEGLGSLAANRYVVGVDPSEEYLLVHQLAEIDESLDPLELG
jgi:hypothetical protein